MFKIGKIIFTIFAALVLTSCSKEVEKAEIDPEAFYDIVYRVTHSRAPGSTAWEPVLGTYELRFTPTSSEDYNTGTFTMHYTTYLEPQFCPYNQNCICSGGLEGSFFSPEGGGQKEEIPYHPFDPYEEGQEVEEPDQDINPGTGKPKTAKIYTFNFFIQIEKMSLSSGCKQESEKTVTFKRFYNGEMIMLNDYRELYLIPVVNK